MHELAADTRSKRTSSKARSSWRDLVVPAPCNGHVHAAVSNPIEFLVLADFTLGEEPLDWSTSITTGTLWGTSEAGATKMSCSWRDASGTSCEVTFTPATNGAFEVVLPAGTGALQREWPLEPYESWERLRFVEIPAAGAIRVDLP